MEYEKSIFENMGNQQLKKYLKFVDHLLKLTKSRYDDMSTFWVITEGLDAKLAGPLGRKWLGRLDVEYLYFLLTKNDLSSDGELIRPELNTSTVDHIGTDRILVRVTRRTSFDSYLSEDLTEGYLQTLKNDDNINPYDWEEVDREDLEIDEMDYFFDIENKK
jgi:hypothetical protein